MFKFIELSFANAPSITLNICFTERSVDVILKSFRIFQIDSVVPGVCKFVDLLNYVLVA
jgi:hypothetical protein